MENKGKMKKKRNVVISVLIIMFILFSSWLVFAEPGSDYNKSRKITINVNGGSTPTMKWMYKYDRQPPGWGKDLNKYYEGKATGIVTDKNGDPQTLGRDRYEKVRE